MTELSIGGSRAPDSDFDETSSVGSFRPKTRPNHLVGPSGPLGPGYGPPKSRFWHFRFGYNFFLFWATVKFTKDKTCAKNIFFSKSFGIFQNFEIWARFFKKTKNDEFYFWPFLGRFSISLGEQQQIWSKIHLWFDFQTLYKSQTRDMGNLRRVPQNGFFGHISPRSQNSGK